MCFNITFSIIASQVQEEADAIAERYGVRSEYLEASDEGALRSLVSKARLVISLLPYELHGVAARACLDARAHLVTASYVTPAVQELHEAYVLMLFFIFFVIFCCNNNVNIQITSSKNF